MSSAEVSSSAELSTSSLEIVEASITESESESSVAVDLITQAIVSNAESEFDEELHLGSMIEDWNNDLEEKITETIDELEATWVDESEVTEVEEISVVESIT